MSAGLLSGLAHQAAWRRDHTSAASMLAHALTRADHPAVRCLLHPRLARTLAAQNGRPTLACDQRRARSILVAASGTVRPWTAGRPP
jgi:hypothetical protein